MFDDLSFNNEQETIANKVKYGGFIQSSAPVNFTISNSILNMHHRMMEEFNVFEFIDSGKCTPTDDSVQYIRFTNNTVKFNLVENAINNFYLNYNNINKRYKEVIISNNTYTGMLGAFWPLVNILNGEPGIIRITDNYIYNCSAITDLFEIKAQDEIIFQNNKFESLELLTKGIISTDNASMISLIGQEFTKIKHNANFLSDPLVKISTQELGNLTIDSCAFHDNNLKKSVISVPSSVGALVFTNNNFYKDLIESMQHYIVISRPYDIRFSNVTFTNLADDNSGVGLTLLILFESYNLNHNGIFHMNNVTANNCSLGYFSIRNFFGKADSPHTILMENIIFKEASFKYKNSIISFGPFISNEDVDFIMQYILIEEVICLSGSRLIWLNMQTKYSLKLYHSIFQNNIGGYLTLNPPSIKSSLPKARMEVENVTVYNNDVQFSTFFILDSYCELTIMTCTINKNSGNSFGSVLKIDGDNSSVAITNCIFNNNNAIQGGLFYITRKSVLSVFDSMFFSNFALTASIAYVTNQGSILFDSCNFSRNLAISVGLVEIQDTANLNIVRNSTIQINNIVSKSVVQQDINDSEICIHLCSAADSYIQTLITEQSLFDSSVSHTSNPSSIVHYRNYFRLGNISFQFGIC